MPGGHHQSLQMFLHLLINPPTVPVFFHNDLIYYFKIMFTFYNVIHHCVFLRVRQDVGASAR